MEMETFEFSPYQRVIINTGTLKGKGTIMGCATARLPEIGASYIIELDDPIAAGVDPKIYPFKCVAVPQIFIKEVSPFDTNTMQWLDNGRKG